MPRYTLESGKFGMYYRDIEMGNDLDLNDVLILLNKSEKIKALKEAIKLCRQNIIIGSSLEASVNELVNAR